MHRNEVQAAASRRLVAATAAEAEKAIGDEAEEQRLLLMTPSERTDCSNAMAAVREDVVEDRARVAVAANLQAQRGTGFAFMMPPRLTVDSLITVLGNGSRRSVRDKSPMRLNPDAVEKLNELAVK
jgi:hypothetical protein